MPASGELGAKAETPSLENLIFIKTNMVYTGAIENDTNISAIGKKRCEEMDRKLSGRLTLGMGYHSYAETPSDCRM